MAYQSKPWILRPLGRWRMLRSVPMSRLWVLLVAVFLLFSICGFYTDLMNDGTMPYPVVFMMAVYFGLNACLWVIGIARFPVIGVVGIVVLQFFNHHIVRAIMRSMQAHLTLHPVAPAQGMHLSATWMFTASILSYVFFLRYIMSQGKDSLRIQNELELAHGIQQTLVPPLQMRTPRFEIYGASHPSEKVGGDLVDAVLLPNGDLVCYLADIAGHGLPASILMGRLKTAARTALLDAGERAAEATLPVLLDRLNTVLPQVKDPQMYATFTGFRLGADGSVFYALAASPPIVQWHACDHEVTHMQNPQLPIGLLPVPEFDGFELGTAPGDLLVVATDGILEVSGKSTEEFGVERLKDVLVQNSGDALQQLGEKILSAARAHGRQFDDQTLLIVRCL